MSETVIDAMRQAVIASPDNVELRTHLATLLLQSAQHEEAWEHACAALASEPANKSLLEVAADAGEACGHEDKAAGYRMLLNALTTRSSGETKPATVPPPWRQTNPTINNEDDDAVDPEWTDVETNEVPPERTPIPAGQVPDSVDDLLDLWDDSDAMPEPTVGEMHRDRLLLRDVGGMEQVKERLNTSFLTPMRNPELQAAFGKSMRGGLLLWGPPGCGKTFIAKAVAGELDANFYSVGLSDVLDMWIGSSERNITSIFETARRNAPCVLFLDEVDALGQKRTHLRGGGGMRGVVNQLLQEMDGATSDNEGVFVLAATNHPWDIDSALLRPGRLDRSLLVLPPDTAARAAILELHLRERPTQKVDYLKCAKATAGLSGADLALVAEQATEYAMTESMKSGSIEPISMRHLGRAVKEIKPSYGPWTESARNYALFNNESGKYDELLRWFKDNKK